MLTDSRESLGSARTHIHAFEIMIVGSHPWEAGVNHWGSGGHPWVNEKQMQVVGSHRCVAGSRRRRAGRHSWVAGGHPLVVRRHTCATLSKNHTTRPAVKTAQPTSQPGRQQKRWMLHET